MDAASPRRVPVRDGWVTVRDLGIALRSDRSHLFRRLKRAGIETQKRRSWEVGNQFLAVISGTDARRFLDQLRAETLGPSAEIELVEAGREAEPAHPRSRS